MRSYSLIIFLVLTISSLSLAIVRAFDGYSVTLAFFFVVLYLVKSAEKIQIFHLMVLFALTSFLMLNALKFSSSIDFNEFYRSFAQTFLYLFCYITSFSYRSQFFSEVDFKKFLVLSTLLIVGFEFFQLLEQFFLHSTASWFWLDGISISTANDIGRFEAVNFLGYYRPISFFHEPSYLGTVLFILFVYNDRKIHDRKLYLVLLLAIVLTLSATVLFFLATYMLLGLAERHKKWLILILIGGFAASIYSTINMLSFLRLTEITTVGTSGWVRLMLPMTETIETMKKAYFGIPLGQASFIFDNSFFLIFSYFGILTPLLFFIWFLYVNKMMKTSLNTARYVVVLSLLLFLNGAIFTLESAFLSVLVNFTFFEQKS